MRAGKRGALQAEGRNVRGSRECGGFEEAKQEQGTGEEAGVELRVFFRE